MATPIVSSPAASANDVRSLFEESRRLMLDANKSNGLSETEIADAIERAEEIAPRLDLGPSIDATASERRSLIASLSPTAAADLSPCVVIEGAPVSASGVVLSPTQVETLRRLFVAVGALPRPVVPVEFGVNVSAETVESFASFDAPTASGYSRVRRARSWPLAEEIRESDDTAESIEDDRHLSAFHEARALLANYVGAAFTDFTDDESAAFLLPRSTVFELRGKIGETARRFIKNGPGENGLRILSLIHI